MVLSFVQQSIDHEPDTEGVAPTPVAAVSSSAWLAVLGQMTPDELRDLRRLVGIVLKPYVSTDAAYNAGVISAHCSATMAYHIRHLALTRKVSISEVVREGMGQYLQGHKP